MGRPRPWLSLLALVLGLALVAGEALNQTQLDDNEQAQAEGREEEHAVVSHVVEVADEVELQSGDGDMDTTGRCASDITHFCPEVKPGEGRIIKCLNNQKDDEEKGNVEGRKLNDECKEEMRNFKIERSTNVNYDVVLANACKVDAKKFCDDANLYPEPGSVITCLREVEEKLQDECKSEIFKTKLEASKDYATDAMLHELCEDDAKVLCDGVKEGEGRVQECLRKKRPQLSWDCQEELFRKEVEDADDLRLNAVLIRACSGDKKQFCKDVKPGMGEAKMCLENNREKPGFSSECKTKFEEMMARRSTDFRLDEKLRSLCRQDIEEVCGYEKDSMDSIAGYDGRVIECLQDYKEELSNDQCKASVHKLTERAAQDIRMDRPLADACYEDRKRLCEAVSPGSARVLRCLQDSREQLSYECRATLFDQEVRLAEDIDFKFPMKKACAKEITTFCKDVPHGHARIISCLQEHDEDKEMSSECKAEVKRDEIRAAEDYRLNYRLNKACDAEIDDMCADVCSPFQGQACGGTVIKCLTDKEENITNTDCRNELFGVEKKEGKDWRNDAVLKEACEEDVNTYCSEVEAGGGRVHNCLLEHKTQLSESCAKQEEHLMQLQSGDVRLQASFKACSEEMAVYCKTVEPGRGRTFRCLQNNLGKVDFSAQCREQVERKQARMAGNWKMDYGVAHNCKADVTKLCPDKVGEGHGKGAVLKCLVEKFPRVSEGNCANEVSRAVRMSLWQYRKGSAMTAVCDEDAAKCTPPAGKTLRSVGVVGRCLSKKVVDKGPMTDGCKAVVTIAAPKDAKQMFEGALNGVSILEKVAELEKNAGITGTLTESNAGSSMITITGWVALASMGALILVLVAGVITCYRKYTGKDRPYTLVVKGGDV